MPSSITITGIRQMTISTCPSACSLLQTTAKCRCRRRVSRQSAARRRLVNDSSWSPSLQHRIEGVSRRAAKRVLYAAEMSAAGRSAPTAASRSVASPARSSPRVPAPPRDDAMIQASRHGAAGRRMLTSVMKFHAENAPKLSPGASAQ